MRSTVTRDPVVSYAAVSPLPSGRSRKAVYSLLRYLSGRPGRTLSAIVLYGARKFLNHACKACPVAAIKRSQTHNYTSIFEYKKTKEIHRHLCGLLPPFPKSSFTIKRTRSVKTRLERK